MAALQAARAIEVSTPLGGDALLFYRMNANEELGRLFQFDLELLSEDPDILPDQLLGQNITVRLALPDNKTRYFNGYVSRFSAGGTIAGVNGYFITLHPWLWFLTRTSDCRIFQEMKVPDIVKKVMKDNGFTDFEDALSGTYRTWEYCVQYRETDFNFISRLMEQEGIYYYFKHENGKHTMVLSDSISSHEPYPGYEEIPYYPPDFQFHRERDHIYRWSVTQAVQPGKYALNDYDFEKPQANLEVKSTISRPHAMSTMEMYDYPGEYTQTGDAETYVRTRIEELHARYEGAEGQASARGLAVGSLFTLKDYYRSDQNREYLISSALHQLSSDEYGSGSGSGETEVYTSIFKVLPSKEVFRPERVTPKPMVQGSQTALVVGPSGEEIWTDKYGRVKVMFHWDRYAKGDETSSCWVRVSQVWAGNKWGGIHIPRIGQEVIVEFLEGDPDRPIITGRVYNNDNMPPYDLPANATISGIKSRSSKGGSPNNQNVLQFEDKKGEEQIFLHAEKDHHLYTKNDQHEFVGNESHLIIKKNQYQKVEGDKHISVKGNHNEKVDGTVSLQAGMDFQEKVGMKHALDAGMEIHLKSGMNVVLEAGMSITLKAGGGFVVVGPAGVTISGTPVLMNSGGAAGSGAGCSPQAPEDPKNPMSS